MRPLLLLCLPVLACTKPAPAADGWPEILNAPDRVIIFAVRESATGAPVPGAKWPDKRHRLLTADEVTELGQLRRTAMTRGPPVKWMCPIRHELGIQWFKGDQSVYTLFGLFCGDTRGSAEITGHTSKAVGAFASRMLPGVRDFELAAAGQPQDDY